MESCNSRIKKINIGEFARTFYLSIGELEYKITRGSWDTEALNFEGNIPNNHKIVVTNDTNIVHVIHEWRDNNTPKSKITGNAVYPRDFYSPQLNNRRDVTFVAIGAGLFRPHVAVGMFLGIRVVL